jgi:glutamate-5-semialdehyde dehydrogenase
VDRLDRLDRLEPGQQLIYGGNLVAVVSPELAAAFGPGDHVLVDPRTGQVLHIPGAEHSQATAAVSGAVAAFGQLARCTDAQITAFFDGFAERLADDATFAPIAAANAADVSRATARERPVGRLALTPDMRAGMVAGLRSWAARPATRDGVERTVRHRGWSVEARRAPLGVVGFVFEGRPNVFADAAGVVRTGNTAVFRIGSDALGTARAIGEQALQPALLAAGLPADTVRLIDSPAHAAGWALFADPRLALAVARGSGPAVAQLGAVARQVGTPVSLHGTGGAWLIAAPDADADAFRSVVLNSLDRKVCNTLNVACVPRSRAPELVHALLEAVAAAGARRAVGARVHATPEAYEVATQVAVELAAGKVIVTRPDGDHTEPFVTEWAVDQLGHEWEWDASPEVSVHVFDDRAHAFAEAVAMCNAHSPRFVASLLSGTPAFHDEFYATVDAPFVGDGMTRWVDGQYALDAPELGLANWEDGRLLGRGGVLSGDSVYTVRYRARISDPDLHR